MEKKNMTDRKLPIFNYSLAEEIMERRNLLEKIEELKNKIEEQRCNDLMNSMPLHIADRHISADLLIDESDLSNLDLDDIPQWPFQQKIEIRLINQNDHSKDHIEQVFSSKDSSRFQKPKKDINIAPGCPLFHPFDRLQPEGFLKNENLPVEEISKPNNNLTNVSILQWYNENTLLWKIGMKPSVYSGPFMYKSYNIELISSFPDSKNGNVKFFFQLLKSEFDPCLNFPFSERVECTLVNLVDQKLNKTQLLAVDFDPFYFGKPQGKRNPGKLFNMDLSLDKMKGEGFVGEDDCVFVKITFNN